jgi:general secretion pathway protein F
VGVISILLTAVVLKVVAQFEHMGQQLPATTRFLIGTSELMQHYGLWFLLLLLVGGFVWRWWLTDDKRRRHWHQVILRLPVIGRVSRGLNTARFAAP